MNKETRQTFLATSASVLLFITLFLILKMDILISALLAVGTYIGVFMISKPRITLGNLDVENMENGLELKALMDEAESDLSRIKSYGDTIKDKEISKGTLDLYEVGNNILEYLKRNPEKITKSRRFFNHYLETSAEIIKKYVEFEKTNITSGEIDRIYDRTKNAVLVLKEGFKKQYVKLVSNEIVDMEADIELLENTLKEDI
ncbi:MAG: 5-bromo-4-chloroindolyl phosphate hydrolysis family protein [Clostridiaceae bacterium]